MTTIMMWADWCEVGYAPYKRGLELNIIGNKMIDRLSYWKSHNALRSYFAN